MIPQNLKNHANPWICVVLIRIVILKSDPGRIQTCNPQSRNLMRYSVAPRGLFFNFRKTKNKVIQMNSEYF